MPLTLLSNPENVHFARNPAVVKIRADQDGSGTLFDAVGLTAKMEYVDADRFLTDETFVVEYEEADGTTETVTFTAKASPSGTNQFYNSAFGGTDTEYWVFLKNIVATHPRIAPFFTVSLTASGGNKLNVIARSTTAITDLTVTNGTGLTVTDHAIVADTTPANYKVRLEVYFESTYGAGDYSMVAQLHGTPEAGTGSVWFDLSNVLAGECRTARAEPLVPVFGTNTPFLGDNFRRWYARYTEEYGAPVEVQDWAYGSVKIAYDGGVSQSTFAEGDFLGAMDDEDSLLTWMPDGKKLSVEQPEYLSWYNHSGATQTAFLRVVWYDITDGAAQTPTDYFTPGLEVADGETAVFPVWPALFGLDAEADAYKYTVQVVQSLDDLSQARTYYIDRDYYESERYLSYLNSFGCPETWRCTGDWTKKIKIDRQTAMKPLAPGYNSFASDRFQFGRLWENELVYRTGFLSAAEAEVLQEMLLAGEVYDVSSEGYIPLQMTTSDFNVVDTRESLRAYEFRAQPRLDMKNYSKKKLSSLLAGAWQEPGGAAWFDAFLVAWGLP